MNNWKEIINSPKEWIPKNGEKMEGTYIDWTRIRNPVDATIRFHFLVAGELLQISSPAIEHRMAKVPRLTHVRITYTDDAYKIEVSVP